MWSPCTNHVISCKEGGIEWASLKKSMLKKLQRSFFSFCLGVLWRLDISECGIAVQALLWTIQKIPVYVPVTALDEALCPTELTVCTDQGNRGLEGEKRHRQGIASLKFMPKIKDRDENSSLPSRLLIQCSIHPNLLSQDNTGSAPF